MFFRANKSINGIRLKSNRFFFASIALLAISLLVFMILLLTQFVRIKSAYFYIQAKESFAQKRYIQAEIYINKALADQGDLDILLLAIEIYQKNANMKDLIKYTEILEENYRTYYRNDIELNRYIRDLILLALTKSNLYIALYNNDLLVFDDNIENFQSIYESDMNKDNPLVREKLLEFNSDMRFAFGVLSHNKGNSEDAQRYFREAVSQLQTVARYNNFAVSNFYLGNYPEALVDLDSAIGIKKIAIENSVENNLPQRKKIDDNRLFLLYKNRAIINLKQEKWQNALLDMQNAWYFSDKVDVKILINMGFCLEKLGKFNLANEFYIKAIESGMLSANVSQQVSERVEKIIQYLE